MAKANDKEQPQGPGAKATEVPVTAEETRLDETVPGGRFIVNGIVVNAEGEVIE